MQCMTKNVELISVWNPVTRRYEVMRLELMVDPYSYAIVDYKIKWLEASSDTTGVPD